MNDSRYLLNAIVEEIESQRVEILTLIEESEPFAENFRAYLQRALATRERELAELQAGDRKNATRQHHDADSYKMILLFIERSSEVMSLCEELQKRINQLLSIQRNVIERRSTNPHSIGESSEIIARLRNELDKIRTQVEYFRRLERKLSLSAKEKENALHEKDLQLENFWNQIQAMRLVNRVKRLLFLDRIFTRK